MRTTQRPNTSGRCPRARRRSAALLGVAALLSVVTSGSTIAVAQRPSSWTSTSAQGIAPGAVQHRGKMLYFEDNGRVHVFSSFTRQWRSRAVSAAAVLRHANDWLLIEEPGRITAFASMRGAFESIAVSGAAFVVNPPTHRNDSIVLVHDGTTLWAFSGLTGGWVQRTVQPSAAIATQRDVALVAEGRQVHAMSALFSAWASTTSRDPITSVCADGTVGIAESQSEVHGFSAIRNGWATTSSVANASLRQLRDVAVWSNQTELLGFSGVRGAFSRIATGAPTQVTLADKLVVAAGGGNLRFHFFSALHAGWSTVVSNEPAALTVGSATATLTTTRSVTGYSALLDSTAVLQLANAVTQVNATVAVALDAAGAPRRLYSAMTGAWSASPAGAQALSPHLARNGALLWTATGFSAFSARSGRFLPVAPGAGAIPHVDPNSSILAVENGTGLWVFEPRREIWLRATVAGGVQTLRIWRTTMVVIGANDVLGFGVQHGEIEHATGAGSIVDQRVSSEVGAIITTDAVVGFSAVPALTTPGQFPEFRRAMTRGSTVVVRLWGEPSSGVFAAVGIPATNAISIPPIGDLLLDPTVLVPLPPLTSIPLNGPAVLPIPVVDAPGIAGAQLGLQAVIAPPGGNPYLTRLTTVGVY